MTLGCRPQLDGDEQQSTGLLHSDWFGFRLYKKEGHPNGCPSFLCERGDSNPHGVTTRTSNVLVYHSNTLANMLKYYNDKTPVCQ